MEERISELESRVAFQEEMIDQLSDVIANQDKNVNGFNKGCRNFKPKSQRG